MAFALIGALVSDADLRAGDRVVLVQERSGGKGQSHLQLGPREIYRTAGCGASIIPSSRVIAALVIFGSTLLSCAANRRRNFCHIFDEGALWVRRDHGPTPSGLRTPPNSRREVRNILIKYPQGHGGGLRSWGGPTTAPILPAFFSIASFMWV